MNAQPTSTSSPALAASPLRPGAPASAPSASPRSNPTPAKSSGATGPTCPTGATSETSPPGGSVASTCSQVDFLANLTAWPGNAEARAITARSGRKCSELLRRHDPLGCLVRTCLASSTWNSTVCFLTWKASTTPAGRLLFRLVPSMPDTDETACGLLPTPTAGEHTENTSDYPGAPTRPTLNGMARYGMWPTPRASEGAKDPMDANRDSPCLSWVVKNPHLWPTPTKQDGENNAGAIQWDRNTPPLNVAVKMWPTPTKSAPADCPAERKRHTPALASAVSLSTINPQLSTSPPSGQLNPEWVEWLMGYPIGHTALKGSATRLSRKSPKSSSAPSTPS